MINTIFYFPESLTFDQYLDALNSNTDDGIASRTIVFAKQQGKIYNNGKIYGTTYSDVQNLIEQNRYNDEYVREAISNLEHDLQENSGAIDLLGQQYLAINQRLSKIENNGYVSEAQMLSAIAGELDGSTQKSSVRSKVNNVAKEASSALFTEVSDQNDNITALSIVNAITSNATAKANLASSFNSGDNTMWANVVTQTDLNSATSALYAALQNKANDSEVVKKASIIASINSSGESNVSIDADKINLGGDVIAARLTAASARIGGFTIAESKLSNSAVEFNADGSGYLAAGAIKWTNLGGLDINADGLLLDVEHPWTWAQWFGNNTPVKGLASFGIVGDYSNLKYKASYNFDTSEFTYIPALGNQEAGLPSDPKEATRVLANAFSSAIFDGSGFGICLLNPEIDTQRLRDEVSRYNTGTGIYEIESGINNIHPYVHLQACLFDPSYHRIAKECTSGLYINTNTDIGGSLIVDGNVYVPNGNLNFGGSHNISLNNISNQYRLTLNTSNAVDIAAPDEICLLADNTSCWGNLTAEKIIKNNGTSDQFLKADGSVATLKTINGNSLEGTGDIVISGDGSGNYLPLTGGIMTGSLTVNSGFVANTIQSDGVITAGGDVTATGFKKREGQANQFLKADGSVDSNSYALASSLSNYLPLSGGSLTGNLDLGSHTLEMASGDYSSSLNGSSLTFGHTEGQASIRLSTTDKFLSLTGRKILLNGVDSSTYVTSDALSGYIHPTLTNIANGDILIYDSVGSWVNTPYTNLLGGYLPLTGGTLTGDLNMANCKLNFGTPYIEQSTIPGPNGTNQGHILNFHGVDGNGHYDFDKSVHAESFVKLNGTSNEVLMADGSTMTLAELKAALDAI